MSIKVQFLEDWGDFSEGEKTDLTKGSAKNLESKGIAVILREELDREDVEDLESMEKKPGEGINVESMMPGGNFISHEDVEEGDTIRIKGAGEIDDSFDSDRLVLPVAFGGEERQVSIGPENIERISEGFGMNTGNWIGKQIKVALIKKYKGLGQKGIVWKPVKEG